MRCHLYNAAGNRILWIDAGEFEDFDLRQLKIAGRNLARECRCAQEMTSILYSTPQGAFALFWNPDGSEEDLCGNAIRCVAHFVHTDASPIDSLRVRTPRGSYIGRRWGADRGSVCIPSRSIRTGEIEENGDKLVDTGSPHRVRMVESEWPLDAICEAKERSRGMNAVNFDLVRRVGPLHYRVRIFERGVGETFSCGTGAAAIVASLAGQSGQARLAGREHLVEFASGEQLTVTYRAEHDALEVAGPVELLMAADITQNA